MKKLRISPSVSPPTVSLWEKGMKLEFVDPLDMSAIRVATVTKVGCAAVRNYSFVRKLILTVRKKMLLNPAHVFSSFSKRAFRISSESQV